MKARLLFATVLLLALVLTGCGNAFPRRILTPSETLSPDSGCLAIDESGKQVLPAASDAVSSEPVSKEKKLSFIGAGDVLIHEAVFTDAMARATALAATGGYSEKYAFGGMFDGVKSTVQAADVAFVNFECPIAGDSFGARGYPNFNAPEAAGNAIVELGFDVVNLANNHMLDMDPITTGLKNTVAFWKSKPVLPIGGYTENDWDELRILEKNGIRIAFLAYTYGSNYGDVNASSGEYIVPRFREDRMEKQVKAAAKAADFVIVSMHWGDETSYATDVTKPNAAQKGLAEKLCRWGADAVIGTHPHVIQDAEWFSDGDHRMICFYSLGNFISTQHPYTNLVGAFASFDIVMDENGKCEAHDPAIIPHVTYYSVNRDSLSVLLLRDLTEEQVSSHGSQQREDYNGKSSYTREDICNVVRKAVSAQFLTSDF